MTDIKTDIDFDITDLKDAITDLHGGIEEIVSVLSTHHKSFMKNVAEQSEGMKGVGAAANEMAKEAVTGNEKVKKSILKVGDTYSEMVKKMRDEGGVGGVIAAGAPDKLVGLQDGISKLKGSILSELPFGGLIGLMVYGGFRDEEVRAMGAKATRMFQQTGQVASREMGRVGKDIERIGVMVGAGPTGLGGEFASTAAAFAQAGVDIEDVLKNKFKEPIKGSRGTILETSVALDSLFKQGAGTAARQMSEMIRDFNLSASESARVVAALGLEARESGTSVSAFMNSVMRSSQALRTQRVDITEVAEAQLKFQKILKEQGGEGMTKQFAAGYAEKAIGQVTQGLSNMGTGLTAILGERISARGGLGGGRQVTGLEAYYAMREGFQGEGQNVGDQGIFVESIKELLNLTKEMGGTKEEQRYFLEKQGFGFEGAKAIMDLGDKIEEVGDDEEAINNVIKDNQKELNKAFVDRAKETSDFQRALLKIQQGIAGIGSGLLIAVVSGLENIVNVGSLILNYISGGSEKEREFLIEEMSRTGSRSTKAVDIIFRNVEKIFSGAIEGGAEAFGFELGGRAARKRAFYKRQGLSKEIAGTYMGPEEYRETIERAETTKREREREELETLLQVSGLKERGVSEKMFSMGGPTKSEMLNKQITTAYETGGIEGAKRRARQLQQEGALEGTTFSPEMVDVARETAERAKMNIGGKQVTLKAITQLKVERVEDPKSPEPGN